MDDRYDRKDDSPEARIASMLGSGLEHVQVRPADSAGAELVRVMRLLRDDYTATAALPDPQASARMLAGIRETMAEGRSGWSTVRRLVESVRRPRLRPAWIAVAAVAAVAVSLVVVLAPDRAIVARSGAMSVTYAAPDGSVITLRPHSRLVDVGDRAYELEGEAHFDVTSDPARPFTVAAGGGMIRVLGTRFTVGTWGGSVRVFVDEGLVRFEGTQPGASVDLEAGEGAELVQGQPVLAERIGRESSLDWMEGALVLDSQVLDDVAAELGQHFGIRIDLPAGLGSERLSGRILLPDAEQALTDLGIVVGGEFVRTGPAAFRFEPR